MKKLLFSVLTCAFISALGPQSASAARLEGADKEPATVRIPLNKSRVVTVNRNIKKVSVGSPKVADILILRSRQVYVVGKSLGTTNVVLWNRRGQIIDAFNVEVTHDLPSLKAKLHELMPDEQVSVYSSQGSLVLSGQVSDAQKVDTAVRVARSFLGNNAGNADEHLVNLLQVGGSQQVMLEVQVAEVSRDFLKRIGAKFEAVNANSLLTIGAGNNGTALAPSGAFVPGGGFDTITGGLPATQILRAPMTFETTGLFASFLDGDTLFDLVIDAAQENNLAKVLAEPTLTTLTGQEATFHAGGEFPIPVGSGQDNGIKIEFKEFGVSLGFLPTVLDSNMISLKLNIKVSELSNQNSIALEVPDTTATFFINALTSRSASSTVELANGQTIGVAGLINETLRERVDKFPGLGDLPILGNLFRSQEFIKGKTELVILVTPHFAKPVDRNQFTLPTDYFVEPSDLEFYLLGYTEGRREPGTGTKSVQQGSVKGQFGHEL